MVTLFAGHRNIRAFITHGGLLSTQEAIYHGVPMVGLPGGSEQLMNMHHAATEGVAVVLDWKSVTSDAIAKALQTVINEPRLA
jgi:glucuronosyltransferase